MADSTVMDASKMKVVDLRKELKSRGLPYAGDKAELVARLQAAISQDEHGDINLDSDEIDSDGVLEDEDDKSHGDILEDSAADTLNEELALSEQSPSKPAAEAKPQRTLKRKLPAATSDASKENSEDKSAENKDTVAKKIVLNRATSITSVSSDKGGDDSKNHQAEASAPSSNRVKITALSDTKSRLEMRAKRFGLPVKMSEDERKEARKQRFGQGNNSSTTKSVSSAPATGTLSENMEKLRKRAERFGQSVSKIMTDIENKEKLEKRKAKFGGIA